MTTTRQFYTKRIHTALREARALILRGRRAEAFARLSYAAGMRQHLAESIADDRAAPVRALEARAALSRAPAVALGGEG